MFIKKLVISTPNEIIRDIEFMNGLNLIIDNTPTEDKKTTGNNVGKTTVLKCIDFCLGASPDVVYTDTENRKQKYELVKNFLFENRVSVKLFLTDDLHSNVSKTIVIERDFVSGRKGTRKINGKAVLEKDFIHELETHIFQDKEAERPTFRQLISHNIRYKDHSINNTLKTLDPYTKDLEYEALYLYMLGCPLYDSAKKQALIQKRNGELIFYERLSKNVPKNRYEVALSILENDIKEINNRKRLLNVNENLEADLETLNQIRYKINKHSSFISKLEIRKALIEQSMDELNKSSCTIDMVQLRELYDEALVDVSKVQKRFEDLVNYHNNMVLEKIKYIANDLPEIKIKIAKYNSELAVLLEHEKRLADRITKSDSFDELEALITEINEKYRKKGEYESIITQLEDIDNNIAKIDDELRIISEGQFNDSFEQRLKKKIIVFNQFFSGISQELYGEKYALSYKVETNKKGQKYYCFEAFNANLSSGKKQGEILCFDLAYILFADSENISCLHFLLNDKKELMHDNQLIKIADYLQSQNIQLVISILKDKLPDIVLDKAHVVVELSPEEKLFKIEKHR